LPKWFGRLFIYNEYIVVAEKWTFELICF
jgi:hypothetical protein